MPTITVLTIAPTGRSHSSLLSLIQISISLIAMTLFTVYLEALVVFCCCC